MLERIIELCEKNSNDILAVKMQAYMKDHFQFYGIKSELRKTLVKQIKSESNLKHVHEVWPLALALWKQDHRELHYMAIDLLSPFSKKMSIMDLSNIIFLITNKSWWDTVDAIASHFVGSVFKADKEAQWKYCQEWIQGDNMWLQRTAIIHQLKYGKNTDWDLLCHTILAHEANKTFFIRKAQGWALRQYGKFEPLLVKTFIEANPQLSTLTKTEALKHIIG